jgi:AcrR family transcriptional regulator
MSSLEQDDRDADVGMIAPIYRRLPKGPHGIDPQEVAHHQRIRMHGAMIEAVASRGYENTSVRHVIGLAGVSRRAFYEQFANKEDCFMATFDLIVTRAIRSINGAYRSSEGLPEERMRTAFAAFMQEVQTNSKALHLVVIDAQTAGTGGRQRLRRTTGMFEGLLANSASPASTNDAIPVPIVRAIVGGLRRSIFLCLRDGRTDAMSGLAEEMLRWFMIFQSPAVGRLHLHRCPSAPSPTIAGLAPGTAGKQDDRSRVLRSVMDLVLREEYEEVSAPRIADEAGLSIDAFLELYPTRDACFQDSLDILGDDLLQLVADPSLVSDEWGSAVCRTIDMVLEHFAANPAHAMILTVKIFEAGPQAFESVVDLSYELATLLTEGAPEVPNGTFVVEGIAGALWHTLHLHAIHDQMHLLPTVAEYLSYVVLTPFVGAEEAARIVVDSRPADLESPVSAAEEASRNAEPSEDSQAEAAGPGRDDYRRLPGRRSTTYVSSMPTSRDTTITTISGA